MNVSVVDLSASQKKLQVQIPAQKVRQELDKKYRDLAKHARIKGFRPGKVHRNILKSLYGKSIEGEVSSQFIQESFPEALRETDLKPLAEADVDEMHFGDDGAFSYTAVVDVCPPFEVGGYKGLELKRSKIQVSEEQEQAELQKILEQHSQLRTVETERPIQKGDMALIDVAPWVDDTLIEKGKASDHMVEIGKATIHPEFDDHLVGRHAGETFSFELDFPEDAPMAEIGGKRVRFDVTIREIKEKIVPELNDEFAKEIGNHESLEDLKQEIRNNLQKREEEMASKETREQVIRKLLEIIQFDLSEKVIQREVNRQIDLLLHQFESQGLKIDGSRFNTPEIREGYRPQAEKNLRWSLIAQQIAKKENLDITEAEEEEIYTEVARMARMDVDVIRREYADNPVVEQAKESKLQEKVLKLVEEEATYVETSQEENSSDQE
jgi:trigger factor